MIDVREARTEVPNVELKEWVVMRCPKVRLHCAQPERSAKYGEKFQELAGSFDPHTQSNYA
jgi:hypothetical protein